MSAQGIFQDSTNTIPDTTSSVWTQIPDGVTELPRRQLVKLVRQIAVERDVLAEADCAIQRKRDLPRSIYVVSFKRKILRQAVAKIKKAAHNNTKKPWSEVCISVPSEAAAKALMVGDEHSACSETSRMLTWEFSDNEQIMRFLNSDEYVIHPVKFDGRVRACPLTGRTSSKYASARVERLQVKYDKRTGSMTFRFRTYLFLVTNLDE